MLSRSNLATAKAPRHVVHGGIQTPPTDQWAPFEWVEPRLGKQVHGEITTIRPEGVSGSLCAGFWRAGPTFSRRITGRIAQARLFIPARR